MFHSLSVLRTKRGMVIGPTPAKTPELIDMPLGVWTRGGPSHLLIGGRPGSPPPIGTSTFGGILGMARLIGSPYSSTEHRVSELVPVLGSQPAGDVNHKPDGRLPLLSARPAVTPATLKRAATNFSAWWTEVNSSSQEASPLRKLTCHMGSHSITCHPAEVIFPPSPQPKLVLD